MSDEQCMDVIVIGAGISGIAFAAVYLKVHPDAQLLILEKEVTVGGSWNRRRLYNHFWTQWSVGVGEFADMPMKEPPDEDRFHGYFRAKHTTNYLEEYSQNHVFDGKPLNTYIQFASLVTNADRNNKGWDVRVWDINAGQEKKFSSKKLVVATGLTTAPNIPSIPGFSSFEKPIIHTVDFGSSGILADTCTKQIAVLGGGKSAADMVYAGVKAGKEVAWIVRPGGTGPGTFVTPSGDGGSSSVSQLASARAAEALQPSHFASQNLWTMFLHRTSLGQALSMRLWAGIHQQALMNANYQHRPSRKGFENLVPHSPIFWRNNAAGIATHEDFFEIVADNVDVYYDDIESLSVGKIRFKSGEIISADALLLGTGWQDSLDYMSTSLKSELGLPYLLSTESSLDKRAQEAAELWRTRERSADSEVISEFPLLANPPDHVRSTPTKTPYRLFNLMVPVDDATRSFACIGHIESLNLFRTGEIQSLWITAYFDNKLELPPLEKRIEEVAHVVAWNRRRYLSSGNGGNSVVFDTLRYTDRLLAEVGLTSHLKSTWWEHIFSANRSADYAKLRDEFAMRYGGVEKL